MKVTAVIVTRGDVDLGPVLAPILPLADEIIIRRGHRGVWERYEAIYRAENDVIYTQDDDCVVNVGAVLEAYEPWLVTCNMPAWKRGEYPDEIALVGWGSVFDAMSVGAFTRYDAAHLERDQVFHREADRVFTGLSRLKLIDVPFRHMPAATGVDRLGAQPEHGTMLATIRRRIEQARRAA